MGLWVLKRSALLAVRWTITAGTAPGGVETASGTSALARTLFLTPFPDATVYSSSFAFGSTGVTPTPGTYWPALDGATTTPDNEGRENFAYWDVNGSGEVHQSFEGGAFQRTSDNHSFQLFGDFVPVPESTFRLPRCHLLVSHLALAC